MGKITLLLTPNKTPHQNLKKIHRNIVVQKNNISPPTRGK